MQSYFTAVISLLTDNGIHVDRSKFKTLQRVMSGYQEMTNNNAALQYPFCSAHLQCLIDYIDTAQKVSDLRKAVIKTIFITAQKGGFRPSEYLLKDTSHKNMLRLLRISNITWHRQGKLIKYIVIQLHASKANRLGQYDDSRVIPCECPNICGPHSMIEYLRIRAKCLKSISINDPLFVWDNNTIITISSISQLFESMASKIFSEPFTLKNFRHGRATDLAVSGHSDDEIARLIGWRSDIFKKVYIRPNAQQKFKILQKHL